MNITRLSGVLKKEMSQSFASPMAWIVIAGYLMVSGYFFSAGLAMTGEATLRPLFEQMALLLLLFAPLLTMKIISDERRAGSIDMLLSYPLSEAELIAGKFLAVLTLFMLMLLLTLQYPIILVLLASVDIGAMLTGYLGLFLLGITLISAGIFCSSITENSIVAAITHFAFIVLLWTVGFAGNFVASPFSDILKYASLGNHFNDFSRGIIDIRHIIYYITLSVFFLLISVKSIQNMRWR